jgi:N-acetylglucosamine-6-phosphate deacetylase
VGAPGAVPGAGVERIDLPGLLVAPGLIDIHVHGGYGIRFDAPASLLADVRAYAAWVAAAGVTGFLCSIAAPSLEALLELVAGYAGACEAGTTGAECLGIHLEGPFLNPVRSGAFVDGWLRTPSVDEMQALLAAGRGWVRQVTLSPELDGAQAVAAFLRQSGVTAAMGHTTADYGIASAALRGDFTHVTHTFNAQQGFHHREPGALGAVLASDGVTAELIADGVHVHPAAMSVLLRCLGRERVVLVSDAMAGAGLSEGTYQLLGREVTVRAGKALLADGTIAGSIVTLDACVRNVMGLPRQSLAGAVRMASLNPAAAIGLADRYGSVSVGKVANLTIVDPDFNVHMTIVRGMIAFRR